MIETKRVISILTDLEGVYEDLLNLYEDIRQDGDAHDAAARRENLRQLGEYDVKLEAYEKASADLRSLIERITQVDMRRDVQTSAPLDMAANMRALQVFARKQPHTLDEPFTFKRPYGFTLVGKAHPDVHTWTQMHYEVCAQLAQHDPERFRRLPDAAEFRGNLGTRFSATNDGFRTPLELPLGMYCEAHLSSESIHFKLRRLLTYFGIPERELVVYLRDERE